jgi:hypothetical protein
MPTSCAVYGCTLRSDKRAKVLGIKFYTFPTEDKGKETAMDCDFEQS